MSNPFNGSLEDNFRGQKVRVFGDGHEYIGYVERIHYHQRHVVLRGAQRVDGGTLQSVDTAHVSHVDAMHLEGDESHRDHSSVERLYLSQIDDAPYACREFDAMDNRRYLQDVREDQTVKSFPTVFQVTTGSHDEKPRYEIIEGHKRIWAARYVGLSSHEFEIVDTTPWAATQRFVADHIPTPVFCEYDDGEPINHPQSGWYPDDACREAVHAIIDYWGERALELRAVVHTIDRLDLADELQIDVDPELVPDYGLEEQTSRQEREENGDDSDGDDERDDIEKESSRHGDRPEEHEDGDTDGAGGD